MFEDKNAENKMVQSSEDMKAQAQAAAEQQAAKLNEKYQKDAEKQAEFSETPVYKQFAVAKDGKVLTYSGTEEKDLVQPKKPSAAAENK